MTDEQPPDETSPNVPDRADADVVPEQELDEVLAQASSLASDLSAELGAAEQATPDTGPRANRGGPPDTLVDLDTELRELEKLVAETGSQIDPDSGKNGADAGLLQDQSDTQAPPATAADNLQGRLDALPTAGEDSVSTDTTPNARSDGLQVPDFMAEFTQSGKSAESDQPESSEPTAAEGASVADESPDIMSELTQSAGSSSDVPEEPATVSERSVDEADGLGAPDADLFDDLTSVPSIPDDDMPNTSGDTRTPEGWGEFGTAVSDEGSAESSLATSAASRLKTLARLVAARLSPSATAACDRIVSLLEVLDRPMDRIGDRVRHIAGWIAVATVGTSLVVYILSLF